MFVEGAKEKNKKNVNANFFGFQKAINGCFYLFIF